MTGQSHYESRYSRSVRVLNYSVPSSLVIPGTPDDKSLRVGLARVKTTVWHQQTGGVIIMALSEKVRKT